MCSNPTGGMDVCCVLSGRGLCDGLITRPEKSYRLWCVVVCDLENLMNDEAMFRVGSQRHGGEEGRGKGEWRKLHNVELNDLYFSHNIVWVIKLRRKRWAGHVARMGGRIVVFRDLVGKPE